MRDLTRLELITEAVRAAPEEVAGIAPHLLDELVDEDWARRYGRPVRLGKNPTRPRTRTLATGNDAIERLSGLPPTEQAPRPRRPTALQDYLDQHKIPRPTSWRTPGT
ncbi:transposase [Streptomyces scabichelini]|uniref:transposase n=1 Tax=Streptomyces scabichelini TaxID=2711217 RepID=UPI001F4A0230|nr:transposase [Streptomyces scabichelini]